MKIVTLPPSYNQTPSSINRPLSGQRLEGGRQLGWGKMLKRTITYEVPWCRANSTVSMGTISAVMSPVVTEIELESKTLSSRVTRGEDVAVETAIFLTVLSIVTVAKTLEASGVHGGKGDPDLFRPRENLCRGRKDCGAIGKINGLSSFSEDRNCGFILVVVIVGGHSSRGFRKRGEEIQEVSNRGGMGIGEGD